MRIFRVPSVFFLLAMIMASVSAQSQSVTESDGPVQSLRATITGNQEQPKVLYIVPWKAAYENNAVAPKPVRGQTQEAFPHLERHEHQRQVEFLQEFATSNGNH